MKIIPIKDFENDYAITEDGNVIHLCDNTIKTPYALKRYDDKKLLVDLYQHGKIKLTITIKELIIYHFFGANKTGLKIEYIDGDSDNLNVYNLKLSKHANGPINTFGLTPPVKIYMYSENGPYIVNQSDLDQFKEQTKINRLNRNFISRDKIKYKRLIPLRGTPEREEHDKKNVIKNIIKGKIRHCKKISEKYLIPFNITYHDVIKQHELQGGICALSLNTIELDKGFKIILKDINTGFCCGNIILRCLNKQKTVKL